MTLMQFWLIHCIMLPCCILTLRAVPPPSDFQIGLSNYSCIIVSGHNVLVGDQKRELQKRTVNWAQLIRCCRLVTELVQHLAQTHNDPQLLQSVI